MAKTVSAVPAAISAVPAVSAVPAGPIQPIQTPTSEDLESMMASIAPRSRTARNRQKRQASMMQCPLPAGCSDSRCKAQTHLEVLKPIKTIEPESLNQISADGEWEQLELAVDSGASESVIPSDALSSVPTVEGQASRRGVLYEVANGTQIPNEGEKRFVAVTEEGVEKRLVLQVCDVNQGLISASKLAAAGNRVMLDEDASYIENKKSGQRTWLKHRNGMYIMSLWVRRQSSSF